MSPRHEMSSVNLAKNDIMENFESHLRTGAIFPVVRRSTKSARWPCWHDGDVARLEWQNVPACSECGGADVRFGHDAGAISHFVTVVAHSALEQSAGRKLVLTIACDNVHAADRATARKVR